MQIQDPNNLIPLGEATDVWGIGRIAWQLIVNRRTYHGPMHDEKGPDFGDLYEGFIPLSVDYPKNRVKNDRNTTLSDKYYWPTTAFYSGALKDLVRACLNFNTTDRPSLRDIR